MEEEEEDIFSSVVSLIDRQKGKLQKRKQALSFFTREFCGR